MILPSVADLDPGSGAFLPPGSGIRIRYGKKSRPGIEKKTESGIRNLFDPGSGMKKIRSRLRDKHPGPATLILPISKTMKK
jgi:hypothetical protein